MKKYQDQDEEFFELHDVPTHIKMQILGKLLPHLQDVPLMSDMWGNPVPIRMVDGFPIEPSKDAEIMLAATTTKPTCWLWN